MAARYPGLDHHPDHWLTNCPSSGLLALILSGQDGLTTQLAARMVGVMNNAHTHVSRLIG
jgi:hypothetical protein